MEEQKAEALRLKEEELSEMRLQGFPGGPDAKESDCNAGDPGSISGSERSWRREWLPTPVFLPGEFHGLRSLVGYSPDSHKGSDTTK